MGQRCEESRGAAHLVSVVAARGEHRGPEGVVPTKIVGISASIGGGDQALRAKAVRLPVQAGLRRWLSLDIRFYTNQLKRRSALTRAPGVGCTAIGPPVVPSGTAHAANTSSEHNMTFVRRIERATSAKPSQAYRWELLPVAWCCAMGSN